MAYVNSLADKWNIWAHWLHRLSLRSFQTWWELLLTKIQYVYRKLLWLLSSFRQLMDRRNTLLPTECWVYCAAVYPVLLSDYETGYIQMQEMCRLQIFDLICLGRIVHASWDVYMQLSWSMVGNARWCGLKPVTVEQINSILVFL